MPSFLVRNRITITTGAPKTAVTVLILSSVGENRVRARRSQNIQKAAPPRKLAGIIRSGLEVRNRFFTICGTAIPTKDTGPAKAVTQAERRLESSTRSATEQLDIQPHTLCVGFSHLVSTYGL